MRAEILGSAVRLHLDDAADTEAVAAIADEVSAEQGPRRRDRIPDQHITWEGTP